LFVADIFLHTCTSVNLEKAWPNMKRIWSTDFWVHGAQNTAWGRVFDETFNRNQFNQCFSEI